MINIEPSVGTLSDIILSSPVLLNDNPAAGGGFSSGGAGQGETMESEMEIALRISREEELERQRRLAAQEKPSEESAETPQPPQTGQPAPTTSNVPAPQPAQSTQMEEEKAPGSASEDEEARLLEEAKKLSLEDPAEKKEETPASNTEMFDENFDEDVLKTLGLDPSSSNKEGDKDQKKTKAPNN